MGRWHADAAVHAGARVRAVVDRDLARAEALAARYPNSIARSQLAAAPARRETSIVHLCTPSPTHESLAREAIEAGCHVLVEKPLAPTLDATRRLLDLAAERRVLLCPVHQFVFQRGMLRMFGMFDTLPHPFSLLVRLLGSQFAEISWNVARAAAGELRLSGVASGVTAGLVVSMSGRPTVNMLRVIADRGSVSSDLFHGFATFEKGAVSRARKILRPLSTSSVGFVAAMTNLGRPAFEREYAYPGLRELVRRLYLAAAENGANPISPADTLAVSAACDHVVASCRAAPATIRDVVAREGM